MSKMEIPKIKTSPITKKQKEIMIEFIKSRREMYTGKFGPTYTKEKMLANWEELTNTLNSVPEGPSKNWRQWRKTWVDLKKNTKSRLSHQKRHFGETGGGPPLPPPGMDDVDNQMLEIISPVAIGGNKNINESEAIFDFESNKTEENHPEFVEIYIENNNNEIETGDQPSTSKDDLSVNISVPKAEFTPRKKRETKAGRLQTSLKNNERFLQISESNVEVEKNYKNKKLELMERKCQIKQAYYDRKLAILQEIANAAGQTSLAVAVISKDVRDIKRHLLSK